LNRVLRNQVRVQGGFGAAPPLPTVLPHWVEKGTNLVYISKTKGDAHSVRVEKIEDRKQMVVIRFEQDHRIWKRVPFAEIRKFGDGTLRPLWKKSEVATVPQKPKDFVDIETDEEEELGMAEAVDPTAEADAPDENEDAAVVVMGPHLPEGPQLPEIGPQLPASLELAPEVPALEVQAEQVMATEEAEAQLEHSNGAVDAGSAAVSRNYSISDAEAEDGPREPIDDYRELSPESRARAVAAAAAATALDIAVSGDKPKKVKKKRDPAAEARAKEKGREKDPDKPKGQVKEKGREKATAKAKAEKRQVPAEVKEKQKGDKKAARSQKAGNLKTLEPGARPADSRGDEAKAKDKERRDEAKGKDKDNKERVRGRRPPSSSPGRAVPKAGKAPRRY